jgi:mono/diheme cytochrome c family protein
MVVVHQLATTQSIFLPGFFSGPFATLAGGAGGAGGVDGAAGAIGLGVGGEAFFDPGPSSYASGSDHCGGIVRTVVSLVSGTGAISTSPELAGSVVPVDVAVSKGGAIAVASAGFADPNQITVNIRTRAPSLAVYSDAWRAEQSCVSPASINAPDAPTTAVAFDPLTDRLVAQTREPAALWIYDTNLDREFVIGLGEDSVLDTGHEIFHRDGGGGIACASCHPEGTEDGHVWRFDSVGARRTQALDAGIQGTEPFHWGGEFANLPALIGDVLVHRMGGPEESAERMLALQDYLFGLPRRPALRDAHDPAALRGKALFDANEVGCAGCHAGGKFTNNLSLSIGKGATTQVPSLIGVGMRAPFMHDGCAQTLSERFDPACGGSAHGDTSRLSPGDLDDLSAYLESL